MAGFIYQGLPLKANIMLNRSSNYIENQNCDSHFCKNFITLYYLKINLYSKKFNNLG